MGSLHSKGTEGQPLCCAGYADCCLEQNGYGSGSVQKERQWTQRATGFTLHPRLYTSLVHILPPETYILTYTALTIPNSETHVPLGHHLSHVSLHPSQPRRICSPKLTGL